jgi:hypothetical protein
MRDGVHGPAADRETIERWERQYERAIADLERAWRRLIETEAATVAGVYAGARREGIELPDLLPTACWRGPSAPYAAWVARLRAAYWLPPA